VVVVVELQAFIVLSCSIAVCVNFSTFLVIGTTSPVTYQVLGHLKTCLILSFGYVLLRDPFTFRNVAGILVAIFGMGLYSFFSVSESRDKKLADGPSPPLPISSSQVHPPYLTLATLSLFLYIYIYILNSFNF
jgi:drug/metabolite transporter (DMT)-like permease